MLNITCLGLFPLWLGGLDSANVCPCACRKRRLIMGYKLSYTTSLLHAWSSCMQWILWVWTVWHWVILVKVIYCSKGGWVLFLKDPTASWIEILSYSHSSKPDLPVTYSSLFSTWLSVLLFFPLPHYNHTARAMLWVLLVAVVPLPSQLPYPNLLCNPL